MARRISFGDSNSRPMKNDRRPAPRASRHQRYPRRRSRNRLQSSGAARTPWFGSTTTCAIPAKSLASRPVSTRYRRRNSNWHTQSASDNLLAPEMSCAAVSTSICSSRYGASETPSRPSERFREYSLRFGPRRASSLAGGARPGGWIHTIPESRPTSPPSYREKTMVITHCRSLSFPCVLGRCGVVAAW